MTFDPFESRLSRDIRNQLSEKFLASIPKGDPGLFLQMADTLRAKPLDQDHLDFIQNRIQLYGAVLTRLAPAPANTSRFHDPFEVAALLWHFNLYFECHEWLEEFWLKAEGPAKTALQGLIRAAGAHALEEAHRRSPAAKSAARALELLDQAGPNIPAVMDLQALTLSLKAIASSA